MQVKEILQVTGLIHYIPWKMLEYIESKDIWKELGNLKAEPKKRKHTSALIDYSYVTFIIFPLVHLQIFTRSIYVMTPWIEAPGSHHQILPYLQRHYNCKDYSTNHTQSFH